MARTHLLCVAILFGVATFPYRATAAAAPEKTSPAPKPQTLVFEAVSIRPSNQRPGGLGTNASGYFAKGMPLSLTVMLAYFPQERLGREWIILGWPSSLDKQWYDIEAKFDASTAEAWKRMTTEQQWAMVRPMLQAMLAERCKLAAHITTEIAPAYELVVSKRGPKLKTTTPGETPPEHALPIPAAGDAMVANYLYNTSIQYPAWAAKSPLKDHWVFFRTSMPAFAVWLSSHNSDKQVVDRTGLNGKYDFILAAPTRPTPETRREGEASDPAGGPRWVYDLSVIGLELHPGKAPAPVLQVDHIEPPTAN